MIFKKLFYFFSLLSLFSLTQAMVFDNRFFPLYLKPYSKDECALSHLRIQPFITTSKCAFNDMGEPVPINLINGIYNQVSMDKSLLAAGIISSSLFRSDLQKETIIPWIVRGKLESQAVSFFYYQHIWKFLSAGVDFLFMHYSSNLQFRRDTVQGELPEGDENELIALRAKMNELAGLNPPQISDYGFGDIDFFLRFGGMWFYRWKFRKIDYGMKLGVYIPTANSRDINNPASVPIGGDGHWGMYVNWDVELELKQDWKFGAMFRLIKRFEKKGNRRVPLAGEPLNFGTVIISTKVEPGLTFVFNPYFFLEGIRDGLGLQVEYTAVKHKKDEWKDLRRNPTTFPDFNHIERLSTWGMEHVTVGIFYDLAKDKPCPGLLPIISLTWDIPVSYFVAKNSLKTNCVSLIIESNF
ncbi:hypothetical protein M1446_03380 [Candidatus Dependentiae bacterium]|nr:hypothetical protein [Candidatus Dependentiae bacterium]